MGDEYFRNIEEYMKYKKIVILPRAESNKRKINLKELKDEDILDQLNNIVDFHKIMMGDKKIIQKLKNNIGKTVESYKIQLKKASKYIDELQNKKDKTSFEEMIVEHGEYFIKLGKESIEKVYKSDYFNLIIRSMDRNEICLSNVGFNNLRKDEERLEINNIRKINYNMVEMDAFNLLKRFKKKNIELDYEKLILEYCKYENLQNNSCQFILALLSYPYEFVKYCNRYGNKKRKIDEDKYCNKLKNIILKEKYSLL